MKAIIIDDESSVRNVLELQLKNLLNEEITTYQASNLKDGVDLIIQEEPQIVFLDIEMPERSGLEIFEVLGNNYTNFQLVFVTAYNEYAIQAFKLSAIDYLLKPIDKSELKNAVEKAQQNIKSQQNYYDAETLKQVFHQISTDKIAIDVPGGVFFVPLNDIYYFEADEMYTKIHYAKNKSDIICKPLKHFEQQLEGNHFFYRLHRSYIVNLKHLKELNKKDGYQITLDNNATIPISKSKHQKFLKMIEYVFG